MYYQVNVNYDDSQHQLDSIKRRNSIISSKYNMIYQRNIDISFYKKQNDKLLLLVKTNSSFDKLYNINEVISSYLYDCLFEMVGFSCDPVTNGEFIKMFDSKKTRSADYNSSDIIAGNDFIAAVNYKHNNSLVEYKEYILRVPPVMDAKIYLSSFTTEVTQIQKVVNDHFIGHPVHYRILGNQDKDIRTVIDSLAHELYKQKRMLHPLIVHAKFSDDNFFEEDFEISTLMPLCDGGMLVLEIADTPFKGLTLTEKTDAISRLAKIIIKNRHKVLFVIHCRHSNSFVYEQLCSQLGRLKFVDLNEESLNYDSSIAYIQDFLVNHHANPAIAYKLIDSSNPLYTISDLDSILTAWLDNYIVDSMFYQYTSTTKLPAPTNSNNDSCQAYTQLMNMVGLDNIKVLINQILDAHDVSGLYKNIGVSLLPTSKHMCFLGSPGTAKTTVARLIGQIFKHHGILTKGDLIEVDRSQLVDRYVGWTAKNVKELFAKAKGSILFIDEAYALIDNEAGSFGDEAINTIVLEMENCKDDTMVIFAGYPNEMNLFINRNPGLSSRINYMVKFNDYSVNELIEIAKLMIIDRGFMITNEALDYCRHNFYHDTKCQQSGNGRFVRNIIDQAITVHSSQLKKSTKETITKDDVLTLTVDDFEPLFGHVISKSHDRHILMT